MTTYGNACRVILILTCNVSQMRPTMDLFNHRIVHEKHDETVAQTHLFTLGRKKNALNFT
jgi:hypothetical protein